MGWPDDEFDGVKVTRVHGNKFWTARVRHMGVNYPISGQFLTEEEATAAGERFMEQKQREARGSRS
jgi:hypothetical protein